MNLTRHIIAERILHARLLDLSLPDGSAK